MVSSTFREVERLLKQLRERRDPIVARRFSCECVRSIWTRVTSQPYVSPQTMDQCRLAVELTERSLDGPITEAEIRAIDFGAITDNGDDAFIAAAHVGWNLFAPLNGLHAIDEYDGAREIAILAACVGGSDEIKRQVLRLQCLISDCDSSHTDHGQ